MEGEIPNRAYDYGTVNLSADKVLIFGGISEREGTSRDQCYVLDLKRMAIDKCKELFLKNKDSFCNDNYSYYEDEFHYIIAGRYYIHFLTKQSLTWDMFDPQ